MKSPILYLLEVLFCSGTLMIFYKLLLMRKVSFVLCRRYLVMAVVLGVTIPALDIPLYPARTVVYQLPLVMEAPNAGPVETALVSGKEIAPITLSTTYVADWSVHLRQLLWVIYASVVVVLLLFVVAQVVLVWRLRHRSQLTDCGHYTLAEHSDIDSPFSFLRTVFLGGGFEGRWRQIVVRHEVSHVIHHHSVERIVIEIVCCLFWFNPFVWLAGRWLREVQEWEADHDVLEAGYDLTEYRTIIFHQLFGYNPDITCGLNYSPTKNRFAMMTHFKEHRFTLVRLSAVIPIVAGMMMLCSFTTQPSDSKPELLATLLETESVVLSTEGETTASVWEGLPNLQCPLRSDRPIGAYGRRTNSSTGAKTMHRGCDILAKLGTPVVAAADGTVTAAEYEAGWGNYIRIAHQSGYSSLYSHLSTFGVKKGDRVKRGDLIGAVGATGRATTTHLHFELAKNGRNFDPQKLFDFNNGKVVVVAPNESAMSASGQPKSATIRIAENTILFNEKLVTIDQLQPMIAQWLESIPAEERSEAVVTISADHATKMGVVIDVKNALREAGQLKVRYNSEDISSSSSLRS